jgi:hypothetical protein
VVSTPAFALKEYFSLNRSIRAMGMGGAFYGNSDDEYALFYNPAGLAHYRGSWELSLLSIKAEAAPDILSALSTITDGSNNKISDIVTKLQKFQGTPLYGGVGLFPVFHKKHFGIGLLIADTKLDVAVLGRDLSTYVDVSGVVDSGLVVGYGTNFTDELAIGVNLKAIARAGGKKTFSVVDIAQGDKLKLSPSDLGGGGGGIDLDLGATYDIPDLPFGLVNRAALSLNNLLASEFTIARQQGAPPGLVRTLSLGWFTAFPGYGVIDNFNVGVDFAEFSLGGESDPNAGARGGSFWKHVNFGVEMPMLNFLAVRLGFHQGYLTAGVGLNGRGIKLDVATYQEELFSSPGRLGNRRIALRLTLGIGSAPPPPITGKDRPADESAASETKKEEPKKNEELPPVPPAPEAKPGDPNGAKPGDPSAAKPGDAKPADANAPKPGDTGTAKPEEKADEARKPQSESSAPKELKDDTKYIPPGESAPATPDAN